MTVPLLRKILQSWRVLRISHAYALTHKTIQSVDQHTLDPDLATVLGTPHKDTATLQKKTEALLERLDKLACNENLFVLAQNHFETKNLLFKLKALKHQAAQIS